MQVWDTNSLASVCHFGLPDRVFALDMSEVAAVHCLIAVGSAEPQACFASHLIIATKRFCAAQMTSHVKYTPPGLCVACQRARCSSSLNRVAVVAAAGQAVRSGKWCIHTFPGGPQRSSLGPSLVTHQRVAPFHQCC